MNLYSSLKQDLIGLNNDISVLLGIAKKVPGVSDDSFSNWEKTCGEIHRQISEEIIRIAVVGAIKSGKSTFINALLKKDYLKRGAGVVTSIVTRIQKGDALRAKLYLKSYEEVNEDIGQALVLFPSLDRKPESRAVDIRRKSDRKMLENALRRLGAEGLFTNDVRNVNSVLIASYLDGYERVQNVMSLETEVREFGEDEFSKHMDFVSDDSLAVYLKDIKLEIVDSPLEENIEIADCQGSDSPNPMHLAMIQDYMLRTHLIVYVISSRTGIRRADIKFLSMIRKMGIMDNVLFVVNCDLSEHETLDDLKGLIRKTTGEISLIKEDPEVYSFSALYELFKMNVASLSERDIGRLWQWQKEKALVEFSERQSEEFYESFKRKLTSERYFLLLKNHLERMDVIASGIEGWTGVSSKILARDAQGASEITQKVKQHQQGITQIGSVIKNTLDGAVAKLKKDLRNDLDGFFDVRYGKSLAGIMDFIRSYRISYEKVENRLESSGFNNTLYFVYQEFKQGLDSYMTERINPDIIHFIRDLETKIRDHMMMVAKPYDGLIQEAFDEYKMTMQSYGIELVGPLRSMEFPDIGSIKNISGLNYPPARTSLTYSRKIKSEALVRLGVHRFVGLVRKIFKRPEQNPARQAFEALQGSVARIKRETEKSVQSHFKDYRENIKFQYIFKLVDAVSDALYEALLNRFQAYVTDLSKLVEGIEEQRDDKDDAKKHLEELEKAASNLREKISSTRNKISQAA